MSLLNELKYIFKRSAERVVENAVIETVDNAILKTIDKHSGVTPSQPQPTSYDPVTGQPVYGQYGQAQNGAMPNAANTGASSGTFEDYVNNNSGAEGNAAKFCPNCGAQNPSDVSYCGACGSKLTV